MSNILDITETTDVDVSEYEIAIHLEFQHFESMLRLESDYGIDYTYINENSNRAIPEEAILHFNDTLIRCKEQHGCRIIDILTYLTTHFVEPNRLKRIISQDVKLEIVQEVRKGHKRIDDSYSTTLELF